MKFYALMTGGYVSEIIAPVVSEEGDEIPIGERFHPDFVASLVAYDPDNPPPPRPVPPPPTQAELIALAKDETRVQRQPIISVLDGLQASALALADASKATLIETAKQALRDITSTDLSGCATYDQMRTVIKARYVAMVAAAPSLKLAFSEALK